MKKHHLHLAILGLLLLAISLTSVSYSEEETPLRILALGDSYTIGEAVSNQDSWPHQLAARLRDKGHEVESPTVIAQTGWTTRDLQQAVQSTRLAGPFDWAFLAIGVNNQFQGRSLPEYEKGFSQLLETALSLVNQKADRVIILSIPDYGQTPFGQSNQSSIAQEIDAFNAANKRIAEAAGVTYVNVTEISRNGLEQPELVAEDGLHPSGRQYAAWVDEIIPQLKL